MPETQKQGFGALNLPPAILAKLDRAGFVTPTPIQAQAIPPALEGVDLVGIAQTGTGKTLAFGLPIVSRLKPGQVALIIAPTRELADQIEEVFYLLGVSTARLIGGESMGRQVAQLRRKPSVIVATPGRLEDHMERGTVSLAGVAIVVLDEADRMLDMGFAPAIRRILAHTPKKRQTMLFSATMPREIADLAATYLVEPVRIDVAPQGTVASGVDQELLMVAKDDKNETLREILHEHRGTVLVFARTRHGARKIARTVRGFGHSAAELHADRTLAQRRAALDGFKTGEHRVLVATDIAARGIDVKDIALVVNYDVPEKPEDYVHRIGRTGRAGAKGRAIMLATPEQHKDVRDIERLLRTELPLSPQSRLKIERPVTPAGRGAAVPQARRKSRYRGR
ncbi:MAG TPA: DEAD/DEAH box helicase [Fimbriimonadaceae bacterium]|mgnify:CR=1 FL=1|nr:DEAD/DEAH box helicase [Fimbriimonadaceae bacterium]HRJ95840.1 DEAD/DEAH box helicase [Fimbriimonadaceae bacterium]